MAGWVFYPLSYENSWRSARSLNMSSHKTGILHTARISTVKVTVSVLSE